MNIETRLKMFLASAVSLSMTISPIGVLAAETAAVAPVTSTSATAPSDTWQKEFASWKAASASGKADDYKSYLTDYPVGKFAAIARNRIDALTAQAEQAGGAPTVGVAADAQKADTSAWQQEYALWQAASAGNTTAEYEAYLSAYPAGKFVAVAQARIVQIAASATTFPGVSTDDKTAATSAETVTLPADPQQAQMEVEAQSPAVVMTVGTQFTEAQFLDRTMRHEIQGRLTSIGYNTHGTDGSFGPRSRSAISAWQQDNGASPTAFLSGDQIALIRQQSVTRYDAWLTEQASAKPRVLRPRRDVVVVERRANSGVADAAIALGVMGAMLGVAGGLKGGHGPRHAHRCAPFTPC